MKKRKICIITGSRAEWGLFYPLAKEINENKDRFILQIVATGGHLSKEYGFTYREIEKDGFRIDRKVSNLQRNDRAEDITKSVSLGITGIVRVLKALQPDLVFLLGDRFEILSGAIACLFLKVPIAHIHGGELTEGSLDDSIRHAITKMAHLHFVSTEIYRKRVIQMGEEPRRVFNVGALGIDNIKNTDLLGREEFERRINFKLGKRNLLVSFNPSTAEKKEIVEDQLRALLKAVSKLKQTKIIFSKPNPDIYSQTIIRLIDDFVRRNKDRMASFRSLGRVLYLSSLQFLDAVVGNSSSGIIEAPNFGIPTVNIGNRQAGRVKPPSVIDAKGRYPAIKRAIQKALSERFCMISQRRKNPYGDGKAAKRIIRIIKGIKSFETKKMFFDLK
jgi:GDP/UDP-N,N'-diacetylbacillosamine 2-epimerase (hydrolysing)